MYQSTSAAPITGINTVWIRFEDEHHPAILRCQLLGLGADQSLLCGLPDPDNWHHLKPGMICRGHTLIEGETYQFETTLKEVIPHQPALLLHGPKKITRRPARIHPRIPVEITGTVRPTSQDGRILAVLPATMSNLCTMGCQLAVSETTWPSLATLTVLITCHLPGLSHTSKFQGRIEWIDPSPEFNMGIQFQFASLSDVACQDLEKWFRSQQAKLINTVA